ncbi:NAD(+)/NADH kinase [uncultured Ruthenibacterium sp.]|uniref:NAD(+)/NADH kinase n=1 Tax=uncultured Ruthenibacterium sp. TaxID=1905347 RepID=UPI00349E63C8
MTVFLALNLGKEQSVPIARKVIAIFQRLNVQVILEKRAFPFFQQETFVRFMLQNDALSECDIIITIGGDGTILHIARYSLGSGKPLFGINLGRMGFLATVEENELETKLARLVKGDYTLDQRRLLSVSVQGKNTFQKYALNDLVVFKRSIAQTVDVQIWCDDILVNHYQGDGVVVATPTGSTAYSLSAGGPVLDARISGLVVTPICAHSMHSPPMVFSAERKLRIQVSSPTQEFAFLSCDGMQEEQIARDDIVDVSLSAHYISLICFNEADQFEAIDKKLKGR